MFWSIHSKSALALMFLALELIVVVFFFFFIIPGLFVGALSLGLLVAGIVNKRELEQRRLDTEVTPREREE